MDAKRLLGAFSSPWTPVVANMCLVPVILLRNGGNTTFIGRTGSEMEDLFTDSAPIAFQSKSCMLI